MVTRFLMAVDSMWMQVGGTLVTDHLITVVLLGKLVEGGSDDTTPQMKHQVQGGHFLKVEVCESAAISSCLPAEIRCCCSGRMPSLS